MMQNYKEEKDSLRIFLRSSRHVINTITAETLMVAYLVSISSISLAFLLESQRRNVSQSFTSY